MDKAFPFHLETKSVEAIFLDLPYDKSFPGRLGYKNNMALSLAPKD